MTAATSGVRDRLILAAEKLREQVDELSFDRPVTHVYNPLAYAWDAHQTYLNLANDAGVRIVLLGMNPGPWGMAQTGVPFGEIAAVRDWLGIELPVQRPQNEHPKRPIQGFQCPKSEVSGRRLWGLFEVRFGTPHRFFAEHFVMNYCPLVFMEESARNRTPDKLPASQRERLDAVCDHHLHTTLAALNPEFVVGVGAYAEKCLQRVVETAGLDVKVTRILHPSPASPAANKDWAGRVTQQLQEAGIW
jgi:single-strand selective monofunctional uracil DNA glycosylase